MSTVKMAFGQRLRKLRTQLGYNQKQMGEAAGIEWSRYHKYELGRTEPPFEILIKLATLTGVDLDYLVAGQEGQRGRATREHWRNVGDLLQKLPLPALMLDRHDQLIDCNERYRKTFFPDDPGIARPGTPLEKLAHAWCTSLGLHAKEIAAYIANRRNPRLYKHSPVELRVGRETLSIAETIEADYRLVLINKMPRAH